MVFRHWGRLALLRQVQQAHSLETERSFCNITFSGRLNAYGGRAHGKWPLPELRRSVETGFPDCASLQSAIAGT